MSEVPHEYTQGASRRILTGNPVEMSVNLKTSSSQESCLIKRGYRNFGESKDIGPGMALNQKNL
jgi:hypothetical protein